MVHVARSATTSPIAYGAAESLKAIEKVSPPTNVLPPLIAPELGTSPYGGTSIRERRNAIIASAGIGAIASLFGAAVVAVTHVGGGERVGAAIDELGYASAVLFAAGGLLYGLGAPLFGTIAPACLIRAVTATDWDNAEPGLRAGLELLKQGDLAGAYAALAQSYWQATRAVYRGQPQIMEVLAGLAERLDQRSHAERHYSDWIVLASGSPADSTDTILTKRNEHELARAHLFRALNRFELGHARDGMQDLVAVTELDPKNAFGVGDLARSKILDFATTTRA